MTTWDPNYLAGLQPGQTPYDPMLQTGTSTNIFNGPGSVSGGTVPAVGGLTGQAATDQWVKNYGTKTGFYGYAAPLGEDGQPIDNSLMAQFGTNTPWERLGLNAPEAPDMYGSYWGGYKPYSPDWYDYKHGAGSFAEQAARPEFAGWTEDDFARAWESGQMEAARQGAGPDDFLDGIMSGIASNLNPVTGILAVLTAGLASGAFGAMGAAGAAGAEGAGVLGMGTAEGLGGLGLSEMTGAGLAELGAGGAMDMGVGLGEVFGGAGGELGAGAGFTPDFSGAVADIASGNAGITAPGGAMDMGVGLGGTEGGSMTLTPGGGGGGVLDTIKSVFGNTPPGTGSVIKNLLTGGNSLTQDPNNTGGGGIDWARLLSGGLGTILDQQGQNKLFDRYDAIFNSINQNQFPFRDFQSMAYDWKDPNKRYQMLLDNPAYRASSEYADRAAHRRNSMTGDRDSGYGDALRMDAIGKNALDWDKNQFDQISKMSGMGFNNAAALGEFARGLPALFDRQSGINMDIGTTLAKSGLLPWLFNKAGGLFDLGGIFGDSVPSGTEGGVSDIIDLMFGDE